MTRSGSLFAYDAPPAANPLRDGRFALNVSLGDIENCRTQRLVRFVANELATPERATRLVGRCMLMVDGYNDDPRDVSQIPEVRTYFKKLATECQLLPFLLEPVKEEISLYLTLSANGRRIMDGAEPSADPTCMKAPTIFRQTKALKDVALGYAYALNEWLQRNGIAEDTEHPLYKAHEQSIRAFTEFFGDSRPSISEVPS